MANGEKVPPHDIEMVLDMDPLFEQVMIIGEGKPYLEALVVLNKEKGKAAALSLGINMDSDYNRHDQRLERMILDRIAGNMHEFPDYAKVHRVALTTEPWTVENELLRPTL